MSVGGGWFHPGLMLETTRADLDQAWKEREDEASALAAAGFNSMALAFRAYALEIRVKVRICLHLRLDNLPKVCKTHDLTDLIIFSGLWFELSDPNNNELRASWDLLAEFSKKRLNDVRYQPARSLDPLKMEQLSAALDDPTKGVLAWLSVSP